MNSSIDLQRSLRKLFLQRSRKVRKWKHVVRTRARLDTTCVTLEAVVGFVNTNTQAAVTKITTPARLLPARKTFELTTNDRTFLRSLRIGANEAKAGAHNPHSFLFSPPSS